MTKESKATTSNGTKRPAESTPATDSVAKKAATAETKSTVAEPKPDANVFEIHLVERFGIPASQVYDLLLDGKRLSEVVGFEISVGKEINKEYKCAGGGSRNLALVPNKLIVQETWSDQDIERATIIIKFTERPAGADCPETSCRTTVDFTQINLTEEKVKLYEPGWRDMFDKIHTALNDKNGIKDKKRTGRNFCHFEIPAKDTTRASKFYADVFGWEIESWGDYCGFRTGPKTADWGWLDGGFTPLPAESKSIPDHATTFAYTPYIEAHPIEEHEEKVKAAGGKVLKAKYSEWWGTVAECLDTEGNRFFLYTEPGK
ncbi:hypothetical protein HK097_008723 [Rhizophlyctis rosea]|uniref:VOC domain-containing protein n=1 Tax=Rhizophlyctis rosea TaxID=64517 RepID=A0AAD5SJN0_9FUNG|nr:hypothetical protein HK097_008723 [Rhizophlyctis rosea]